MSGRGKSYFIRTIAEPNSKPVYYFTIADFCEAYFIFPTTLSQIFAESTDPRDNRVTIRNAVFQDRKHRQKSIYLLEKIPQITPDGQKISDIIKAGADFSIIFNQEDRQESIEKIFEYITTKYYPLPDELSNQGSSD